MGCGSSNDTKTQNKNNGGQKNGGGGEKKGQQTMPKQDIADGGFGKSMFILEGKGKITDSYDVEKRSWVKGHTDQCAGQSTRTQSKHVPSRQLQKRR